MTPNQIVAVNVARARELRGWTQEQAADALAPYLGARLSGASFSALERSAWSTSRIKQFSADDLLALSRGFDLPIGFFLTPPAPDFDAGLHAPDAGVNGLDPVVLLDAVLGRPENLGYWEAKLRAYSASVAPAPRSKRRKPNVSPADLADRLKTFLGARGQSAVRQVVGDVDDAADVLERMAEMLRAWDRVASQMPEDTSFGNADGAPSPNARGSRRRAGAAGDCRPDT